MDEDIKELYRSMRINFENQNKMLDKFWPWLKSLTINEEDNDDKDDELI